MAKAKIDSRKDGNKKDKMAKGITVYYQNPEACDDKQGVYVKWPGESEPWQTEIDAEEFDALLPNGDYPSMIHSDAQASEYVSATYRNAYLEKAIVI